MPKINGDWIKPRAWAAVFGAVAMAVGGFWGLGWTTAGSADQMARARSETAVVSALVPFCVANARHDLDASKLAKLGSETSSWSRAQLVRDAGWSKVSGTEQLDRTLADECSERLRIAKAG